MNTAAAGEASELGATSVGVAARQSAAARWSVSERPRWLDTVPEGAYRPVGRAATVVHRMPGRVRLRIARLKADDAFAHRYARYVATRPGIREVRVQRACASVVVVYDPQQWPPAEAVAMLTDLAEQELAGPLTDDTSRPTAPDHPWWHGLLAPTAALGISLLGAPPLLATAGLAIAALPIARRAAHALAHERRFNVDALDTTAITVLVAQGSLVTPAGLAWMVALGEGLRERTARASRREAATLLASLQRLAWVLRDGRPTAVPADAIVPGETVFLHPGELVPVDGTILSGDALLNQSALTGESAPVLRGIGETVLAGTLLQEGAVRVRAERVGGATHASRIVQLLDDAPTHDTRAANHAAQFADRLVVPTLGAAALMAGLTGSMRRAASILILDMATGIRVAAPTAVLSTMRRATRSGIVLRSGRAIEQLAEADAVVFDKTGTLTLGRPTVAAIYAIGDRWTPDQLLALAASAERGVHHPAAAAIRAEATRRGVPIVDPSAWEYHLGRGVSATIEGHDVLVGSTHFLKEQGVKRLAKAPACPLVGSTASVAVDGDLVGVILSEDPLRPEAPAVVDALRRGGIRRIVVLTGDRRDVGREVGRRLGVDEVIAESFPEQKVEAVQDLRSRGYHVAFVGDGINDSPALAYADVSVSLRHGADVARETADILLMDHGLRGLPEAVRISRAGMRTLRQGIGIVAAPNALAFALTVVGRLNPLGATLLSNGSALAAGAHALSPMLGP